MKRLAAQGDSGAERQRERRHGDLVNLAFMKVLGRPRGELDVVEPLHRDRGDPAAREEHVSALEHGPRVSRDDARGAEADDRGHRAHAGGHARAALHDRAGGHVAERARDVQPREVRGDPVGVDFARRSDERERAQRTIGARRVDAPRGPAKNAHRFVEPATADGHPSDREQDACARGAAGAHARPQRTAAREEEREHAREPRRRYRHPPARCTRDRDPCLCELVQRLGGGRAHGVATSVLDRRRRRRLLGGGGRRRQGHGQLRPAGEDAGERARKRRRQRRGKARREREDARKGGQRRRQRAREHERRGTRVGDGCRVDGWRRPGRRGARLRGSEGRDERGHSGRRWRRGRRRRWAAAGSPWRWTASCWSMWAQRAPRSRRTCPSPRGFR